MLNRLFAKDFMTKNVICSKLKDPIDSVIQKLLKYKISGIPVVDKYKNLKGIISEKDVINFVLVGNLKTPAEDVMTSKVVTVDETTPIEKVCSMVTSSNFRRVPVIKKGKLAGLISRRDIIKVLYSYYEKE